MRVVLDLAGPGPPPAVAVHAGGVAAGGPRLAEHAVGDESRRQPGPRERLAPRRDGRRRLGRHDQVRPQCTDHHAGHGPLQVATGVDIQGPGADKVTVSGDKASNCLRRRGGVTATISGLTIADGLGIGPSASAAAASPTTGTLTLSDDVITGNSPRRSPPTAPAGSSTWGRRPSPARRSRAIP